jgi:hypothetical protein
MIFPTRMGNFISNGYSGPIQWQIDFCGTGKFHGLYIFYLKYFIVLFCAGYFPIQKLTNIDYQYVMIWRYRWGTKNGLKMIKKLQILGS